MYSLLEKTINENRAKTLGALIGPIIQTEYAEFMLNLSICANFFYFFFHSLANVEAWLLYGLYCFSHSFKYNSGLALEALQFLQPVPLAPLGKSDIG